MPFTVTLVVPAVEMSLGEASITYGS